MSAPPRPTDGLALSVARLLPHAAGERGTGQGCRGPREAGGRCYQTCAMNLTRLTLLNTCILTDYGTFIFQPLSLDEARAMVREFKQTGKTIQSAIGHQSTAELLTTLLEFPVAVSRMTYAQRRGDAALVFKLKVRPPEGKVLTRAELEEIGYEFGLLTRSA